MNEQCKVFQLKSLLECRHGADSGVTISKITTALEFKSRRETEVFLELHIGDMPFAVVSGSTGLYRPASEDDLNHYRAALRSRIRCIAIRMRTVTRAAIQEGWQRSGKKFTSAPTQLEFSMSEKDFVSSPLIDNELHQN